MHIFFLLFSWNVKLLFCFCFYEVSTKLFNQTFGFGEGLNCHVLVVYDYK